MRMLPDATSLDDREPAILADLGDELDISRARVRQLQREAERRLRRPRAPTGITAGSRIPDSYSNL
jgi:DNA-directed RNA polymerase sigma subunit (sigma70/sigma32)